MRYYFSFSSSLDLASFNSWKLQHGYPNFNLPAGVKAQALDTSLVLDFPSRFWGGRVLGLSQTKGTNVAGIAFQIDPKDWPIVQHKEGVMTGASVEWPVTLLLPNGEQVEATAFTTAPARQSFEGPPSPNYFEALKRAYAEWGLDTHPLDELFLNATKLVGESR